MTTDNDDNKTKPELHRDLQIIIGRQIGGFGLEVSDGFFNIFCATPLIRAAALSILTKMSVFRLNYYGMARMSSPNGKDWLLINFNKLSGYLYLKRIIQLMAEQQKGKSITELYLDSLHGMDVPKLMQILVTLKEVTVISLPYNFGNFHSKNLERLIQNNANSLLALKHITLPMAIPVGMRDRLVAISSATLRNGALTKEQDFYAYYAKGAALKDELLPLPEDGGVLVKIQIHRNTEPFRAIKNWRHNLLSMVTHLKFVAVIESNNSSTSTLLDHLAKAQRSLPNLKELEFEFRVQDAYPNFLHTYLEEDDDDLDLDEHGLVSPHAVDAMQIANRTFAWLQDQQKCSPFRLRARVSLKVDYQVDKEDPEELLAKAIKQTKAFFGQRWPYKEVETGVYVGEAPGVDFHFLLDYGTLKLIKSEDCPKDDTRMFGNMPSL